MRVRVGQLRVLDPDEPVALRPDDDPGQAVVLRIGPDQAEDVRDLVLMPVSLGAALIDFILKGEREGARFYKVLRWGSHSEDVIDVYSAIKHHEPGDFKVSAAYTVDGVIARLESVVTREVEKGGTAASIKSAMDRAIDQLHAGTGSARDAVVRTADKLREKL